MEPSTEQAAVIYARYSTDRQDGRSIEDQIRRCQEYAKRSGLVVVDLVSDAAVSGTHLDRAGLQRMLADAETRKFRTVLVDDLSRLSRDLGDVWNLVFGKFYTLGVVVIDVSTGIGSNSSTARMVFGTMGLVSDVFIQMIRDETHRGLQGRALSGFATGGKTYGFTTVVEKNPPDPEHPRKVTIAEPNEAAVVVRIFELFAAGMSAKKIAALLNQESVPAPHDGGKGHKNGAGWGHGTITHMLHNERFIGRWIWNREKWVQIPGTKRYKRLPRPESEWVKTDNPSLRIISDGLWTKVRERLDRRRPGKARTPGTGKRDGFLLSGLLRCGVCGGGFSVIGRKYKKGVPFVSLGCSANRSRGRTVCDNNRSISEKKVTHAVVTALKAQLSDPALVREFVDAFTKQFNKRQSEPSVVRALEKQVSQAETRVRNATEALTKIGFSEAMAAQLRSEEAALATARQNLATAKAQHAPKVLPHPRVVEGYIRDLLALIDTDRVRARELLARHMPPLMLKPDGDRYRITGGFDLALCLDPSSTTDGAADRSAVSEVGGTGIEPATKRV